MTYHNPQSSIHPHNNDPHNTSADESVPAPSSPLTVADEQVSAALGDETPEMDVSLASGGLMLPKSSSVEVTEDSLQTGDVDMQAKIEDEAGNGEHESDKNEDEDEDEDKDQSGEDSLSETEAPDDPVEDIRVSRLYAKVAAYSLSCSIG